MFLRALEVLDDTAVLLELEGHGDNPRGSSCDPLKVAKLGLCGEYWNCCFCCSRCCCWSFNSRIEGDLRMELSRWESLLGFLSPPAPPSAGCCWITARGCSDMRSIFVFFFQILLDSCLPDGMAGILTRQCVEQTARGVTFEVLPSSLWRLRDKSLMKAAQQLVPPSSACPD